VKITGAQIRAARAFLKWNIADLAKAAEVGDSTVRSIEKVDGDPSIKGGGMENTIDYRIAARAEALAKIVATFEKAGITFLPASPQGVGLRGWIKS
jgi:ribosome-binding protein aMBF1 (putative translation factor)